MITKKQLKKKCDVMWSLIVRQNEKCQLCGKEGRKRKDGKKIKGLDAHHMIYRQNYLHRWNVDNGICLCKGCHTFGTMFGGQKIAAHIDQVVFMEKVKEILPNYYDWYNTNKYTKYYGTIHLHEIEEKFEELQDMLVTF
jgi:hypothetical protein